MINKVRFAPSPTGYLHLGNARMLLLNHYLINNIGGEYILRIDDTDFGRVKEEYVEGVREDLKWLGVKWHEEFRQSQRMQLYLDFFARLKQENKVYECYETKEELEYKKKIQLAKGNPPIYDRAMLHLSKEKKEEYEKEGRKPHYRLKIEHSEIKWNDLIKREIVFKGENISDPVVIREDGSFLYLLTSVLDDIEIGITHILRGEDHVVNTAVQIQMFEYLKAKVPNFAHLPLITNKEGAGYSKREGSLAIRNLREKGITPLALHNYLYGLGMGEQNIFYTSVEEIIKVFDLSKYNTSAAKFDEDKLLRLNLQALRLLDFAIVQKMAKDYLKIDIRLEFWEIIKHNINEFGEIKKWYEICHNDNLEISYEGNKELLRVAIKAIPQEDFQENSWDIWYNEIKKGTELKGKELFGSLRKAFSNEEKGPEFKHLILLIGKDRLVKRLEKLVIE